MTTTWQSAKPPPPLRVSPVGWLRVLWRGGLLGIVVFGGLLLMLLVRLLERPLCGQGRPVTPYITQFVCRSAFRIMRIGYRIIGTPMTQRGAIVANHTSWLDIFALNAAQRIYFVSKSEVARWPGIGWLAKATGTVFIERNRARARAQTEVFQDRLLAGHRLLFFPEGTSTDGDQVLPFKTTLFEAFFTSELRQDMAIQPVTLIYSAPPGQDPRFYGWWGDMSFGAHLRDTLAAPRHGMVTVKYAVPLAVSDFANRKTLARKCEDQVRAHHPSNSV